MEESERPVVVVQDGGIIVSVSDFYAVYYKATNQPQLILEWADNNIDNSIIETACPSGPPPGKGPKK